jgi:hypothetical protein
MDGNQTTLACGQYIGIGILAVVSNLNIGEYVCMLWISLRNLYVEKNAFH